MSIKTSSLLLGGTVAATGGTATGMIDKGNTLYQTNVVLDDSSEFASQTRMEYTIKEPKVSTGAPNGYTQKRNTVRILVPLVPSGGESTINSFTITGSVDPMTTEAQMDELRSLAAQAIADTDLSDFWNHQSTA